MTDDSIHEYPIDANGNHFYSNCLKCGTHSIEPATAANRPYFWPCPDCGDDLLRQSRDGGFLIPPSIVPGFLRELDAQRQSGAES